MLRWFPTFQVAATCLSCSPPDLNLVVTNFNFARVQRLGWYGHIERMQETRMVKAIHAWKLISKRPMGRPKIRWEDDVKNDIQRLKLPKWNNLVQDRRRWKEVVGKAKTLHYGL